jgi:SNF2 family DNA or RNA helicase
LERDYNCSNFVQSKDRIHRVGSKFSEVNYEYLVSKGTIDEVIAKRLELKVARMSELVDDDIPFFKLLEDDNEEAILLRESLNLYKKS